MTLWTIATAADEASRRATVAVLPIGSFEQHGPHLPLATDTIVASAIATALAERYGLFLLPPITLSCSHEHAGWRGTVSLSSTTLTAIVNDVVASLHGQGIDHLVLVNGHGGNYVLFNVVQEANTDRPRLALFPGRQDWDQARHDAGLHSTTHDDMHAGEIETSILLHAAPHTVGPDSATADHLTERPHLLTLGMIAYTSTGVIGQPSLATAAKGQAVLASLARSFEDTLAMLTRK
ncbi:creatininase family protein [Micromonospora sp. WMMD710]|uniref:creatininase family protein n=1 Tax=Micromonospora sp. WMMD710 TaxID=3016085 RepID=UPI00241716CB|nr:creatininase family protein [Micromonospora sp. WMMD710]MDG4760427.1 creatininase family protein [Micromonospora sp. WMMD710]